MKKAALFCCFVLAASALTAAQTAVYFKGTLDQALAQAKKDNKPVLIEFYQKGG